MEYSWVSSEFKLSQSKGFFVDNNNQIIYWPTKSAPGYIINHSTALRISNNKRLEHAERIGFFFGLLFIILSPPIVFDILPLDLPFIFVLGLGIGYQFFFRRIIKQFLFQKIIRLYGPFQEIPKSKPKAKVIKPSEYFWKFSFFPFLLCTIFTGIYLFYVAALYTNDPLLFTVLCFGGFASFSSVIRDLWLEKIGSKKAEERFFFIGQ